MQKTFRRGGGRGRRRNLAQEACQWPELRHSDGATMAFAPPPLMCHTRHISGGVQNPCMKKRKKRGRGKARETMQMLMAQESYQACEAYEIGPARKLLKHFQPGSDIHNALVIHRERNHQGYFCSSHGAATKKEEGRGRGKATMQMQMVQEACEACTETYICLSCPCYTCPRAAIQLTGASSS